MKSLLTFRWINPQLVCLRLERNSMIKVAPHDFEKADHDAESLSLISGAAFGHASGLVPVRYSQGSIDLSRHERLRNLFGKEARPDTLFILVRPCRVAGFFIMSEIVGAIVLLSSPI